MTATTWADLGIELPYGANGQVRVTCPKCTPTRKPGNQRRKDLAVNTLENVWHCHHCGWSGSLKGGTDAEPDWRRPVTPPRKVEYHDPRPLPSVTIPTLWDKTVAWFAERGIPEATMLAFNITASVEYCPVCDSEVGNVLFPYYVDGTHVNTKHRCGRKHFRMEKGAQRVLYNLDACKDADTIVIVEGECLTGNTEILTDYGWIRLDQYTSGRVAQVHEGGRIEMVDPLAKVRKPFRGDMVRLHNSNGYALTATPEHRMAAITVKGRWRIHTAQQPISRADSIPRVGILDGPGIDLTDDQIALCLAVSADASVRVSGEGTWRYGEGQRYAVFGFRKDRKSERLRSLLNRLGIKAADSLISGGYQSICFHLPEWVPGRFLPHEWIAQLSLRQREFILSEMVEWDGNSVPNRNQHEYCSKYIENATFMQAVAHTSGRVSTIIDRKNEYGHWYKVSILHGKTTTSWQSVKSDPIPHDGLVYCVTVPTGMILVRHEGRVSVTGNCDAMAVHTAGIPHVVSVPDGAPAPNANNYASKFTFLEAAESLLESVRHIVIATDADEPGQKLMDELARRLGPERCSRVIWDEGIKDANEALVQAGPDYLRACIEDAEPWPVEGIITANDLARELDDLYDNGTDPGLKIGYPLLDKHYRIKPGYMSIVTGIPSHGKSGVVDQVIVKLAESHGWAFTIFSPEQQPVHKHIQHLIELHVGEPMLQGPRPRMSRATMHAGRQWVGDHFSVLTPEEPSIDAILALARIEVFRRGIKGMVVDPWNELEHLRPRHQSETEYISDALSKFRRFAIAHQVHIWIVAHPTKLRRNDDGSEPVPTLYDIAGSANFRNKADIGISVWRDLTLNDSRVEIHITKVRYADQGALGRIRFAYDPPTKRLTELEYAG